MRAVNASKATKTILDCHPTFWPASVARLPRLSMQGMVDAGEGRGGEGREGRGEKVRAVGGEGGRVEGR